MSKMSKDVIRIKESACEKYGFKIDEFLGLLLIHKKGDYEAIKNKLLKDGLITPTYKGMNIVNYSLMDEALRLVDTIILESTEKPSEEQRIANLAIQLKELFPKGKKEGTIQYWKGNTPEIKNRLKLFLERYGNYSDEDIINATKRYIKSFEKLGNYQNMRLLKYFIWKRDAKFGEIEESSDLMAFIENEEDVDEYGEWNVQLK